MKKRVLITGASGFVGFHLINEAVAADLEVYAAVRSSSDTEHLEDLPIHYVQLNYASVDELAKILSEIQFDYIIHAAGTTKAKTAAEYNKVNAQYTMNLALAILGMAKPIEKFVFVSSLAAIGPLETLNGQIEDDTKPQPVTNYGKSKVLAETYLRELPDLPLVIIRPTAVYGPREKDILILFKSINKGIEPYIGSFKQQFSFVYVKDLAHIIVKALTIDTKHKTYNVSDGHVYNRYALANVTKELLNKRTLKFHLPVVTVGALASLMDRLYKNKKETPTLNKEKMAELTAVNWACNIQTMREDFGFTPQFNLKQGLAETLKWYKNNNWL
jgi:nucleoside-diphosphate-sugar epimerase